MIYVYFNKKNCFCHQMPRLEFLWVMKSCLFAKDDEILMLNGVSQHAIQIFLKICARKIIAGALD